MEQTIKLLGPQRPNEVGIVELLYPPEPGSQITEAESKPAQRVGRLEHAVDAAGRCEQRV